MPRSRRRVRGQGRPLTQLELHAYRTPPLYHRGAAPSKPVVRRGAREERVSYSNFSSWGSTHPRVEGSPRGDQPCNHWGRRALVLWRSDVTPPSTGSVLSPQSLSPQSLVLSPSPQSSVLAVLEGAELSPRRGHRLADAFAAYRRLSAGGKRGWGWAAPDVEVLLPPGRRLGVLLQILDCCLGPRGKRGL